MKLVAPNGKPSNLTPEQYRLVRTFAFKNWFGDWINSPETASKVVDENGEPLVCFHGSDFYFNIFNSKLEGKSHSTKRRKGKSIYFSDRKDVAESFIKKYDFIEDKHLGKVYECFLSLKNPKIIDGEGQYIDYITDKIEKVKGNTSIIILDVYDSINQNLGGNIYIATSSNQIKLADGTNTTFDANNPDIRYKDGGNTTQDFWAGKKSGEWFSRKLRIDQLRIGKEFLLARRNFKIQKSKVDKQQEPVSYWQHRDSVYDEKGMAIGNDWYNNITDDVLLLSDLYNEFIELREEEKKLVNSNKEELEKIGYNDWKYKNYFINKRVEWNMHDNEGVLEGLGSNESIIAIGTKSYCKEIQNNEAKEEYEYYIEPSKTEKGLYVLREVWLGYYLKSGGNINDFKYEIGGL